MSRPPRKSSRSRRNNNSRDKKPQRKHSQDEYSAPPEDIQAELIPEEELQKEARKREKQQPLLKRIAKAMNKEADETFKELIINSEPLERRMAFLEDGVLQKFEVEKTDQEQMVGAIFKGKIQNHEPGIKAAFIDINQPKNAFLHYWDIVQQGLGEDVDALEDDDEDEDPNLEDDVDDEGFDDDPDGLLDPVDEAEDAEETEGGAEDSDDDAEPGDAEAGEPEDSGKDASDSDDDEDAPSEGAQDSNEGGSSDSDDKGSGGKESKGGDKKSKDNKDNKGKGGDKQQGRGKKGRGRDRDRGKNKAKQANRRKSRQQTPPPDEIIKDHPIGSDIIVQITKAQIGTKGPRTTTNLAIPGRFMVLMPYSPQSGISRKIEDREERKRLKQILAKLEIPKTMGVIIRTAGQGKKLRYFERDLAMLVQMWEEVDAKIQSTDRGLVYKEPDIIGRTVRDFLTEDIDRVLIDSKADFERIQSEVSKISRQSKSKVSHFKDDIPIFERFNIERQIEQTFARTVPLPSGGEIVIEETEALTAIDVNTGGHRIDSNSGKNFILDVNLEAAKEVARQVRLRNIGGLIIVDFIDMKRRSDRNNVFHTMRRYMDNDRARSHVLPISQLGILQMTRQRHHESNYSTMFDSCPYCRGRGIVKSSRTVSVEIQRRITAIVRRVRNREHSADELHLRVTLHPENLERLRTEDEKRLVIIEQEHAVKLSFRADPNFHLENFNITNAENNEVLH